MTPDLPEYPRRGGCLQLVAGSAVVALSLPFVTALRLLRRWRRGDRPGFTVRARPLESDERCWLEADVDVPLERELQARREIVECIVRLAAELGGGTHHLVFREPGERESALIPLGPLLQSLGDRMIHTLGRASLEGRTVLWLGLAACEPLGGVVDPVDDDPEVTAVLHEIARHPALVWCAATSFRRGDAAILQRTAIVVDEARRPVVEAEFSRLEKRLAAPR